MGFLTYYKEHIFVSVINTVSFIASLITLFQSITHPPLDKANGTGLKAIFMEKNLRNRAFFAFISIFLVSLIYIVFSYNNTSNSYTTVPSSTSTSVDSNDTSSASSSSNTVITIQDGGTGIITNGDGNTINNGETSPNSVTITDVFLDIKEHELYPNQSKKLTATVVFSNNSKETSDENESNYLWTSSNTSVAEVDKKGNVTAHLSGTAIITVQASKNNIAVRDSCTITVKDDTTKENSDALSEKTKTPSSTSSTTYTTVTGSGVVKSTTKTTTTSTSQIPTDGIVTITKKEGNTTATSVTPAALVTVTDVSLDITEVEITPSQSVKLTATTVFSDNTKDTSDDNESNYLWVSSNTSVAEVDNKGNVTALSSGTAKITVQASRNNISKSDTCVVTVKEPISPPSGYSISLSSSKTTINSEFYINIEPYDNNYTEILVHAESPSGTVDTLKWDAEKRRYYIYTETGIWKIYATIINEAGRYDASNPTDYATIEIVPIEQYIDDLLKLY